MKSNHLTYLLITCCIMLSCDRKPIENPELVTPICDCDYQKISYNKGATYLWLPNSFTPNFDGLNDVFKVYHQNLDTSNFRLAIYSPQQKLIFTTSTPSVPWDGKFQGTISSPGEYPVIILYKTTDGADVEKRFCIYLLEYNTGSNCFISPSPDKLLFPDQFNPSMGIPFATNESICP